MQSLHKRIKDRRSKLLDLWNFTSCNEGCQWNTGYRIFYQCAPYSDIQGTLKRQNHSQNLCLLPVQAIFKVGKSQCWTRILVCVCVISITDRFIECLPNMAFVQILNFVQIKRRVCSDRWKNRFIIPHSGPQKNTMKRQGCTLSDSITSLPTIVRKDLTAVFKQLIISQRGSGDEKSRLDTAPERNSYFLACPKPKAHQSRS